MRATLVAIALLGAGCSADATPSDGTTDTSPSAPIGSAAADDDPERVRPQGFGRTAALVTPPDGEVCELCLWLADDADQRRRGLMFVTDLGPGDGMAFRYPSPHTGRFWMKNTVLPLSIAFFAPDGSFVEAFDMAPCTRDPCPRYRTPDDFLVAVEVRQGDLPRLGIVPGSDLELLDAPCDT